MQDQPPKEPPVRPSGRCPICKEPQDPQYRPFCSRRCADLDLGRWVTGAYALPAEEEDDPDEEAFGEAARREDTARRGSER